MSAWRQTGVKPKELEEMQEFPKDMSHVWKYFIDLNNARSGNGFGANPISYTEMMSYFQLLDIMPDEWEVDTIRKLDIIALDAFADQAKKEQKKK